MPTLYVAATPIGNLSDASPRLLQTLGRVGLIAAEDTRVTGNLLRHFGVTTRMTSLHRHNEAGKAEALVRQMVEAEMDAALVSDAGTPAISDPGYLLVRAAAEAGIDVVPIPGPSAMAAALSICGFDTRTFAFYGFLPRQAGDLRKRLLEIAGLAPVAVAYESPHRVTALLESVAETLPGCQACVCCDLTKLYEKTLRGPAEAVARALRDNDKTEKGEYCVVLDFSNVVLPAAGEGPPLSVEARLMDQLLSGATHQEAVARVAAQGVRRNEAKRALLTLQRWIAAWQEEDGER